MDKGSQLIDRLLEEAKKLDTERDSLIDKLSKCEESRTIAWSEYRMVSTCRVLEFILDEYRDGRLVDLDELLVHCVDKLHGMIDGTELSLSERGKPIAVLPLKPSK